MLTCQFKEINPSDLIYAYVRHNNKNAVSTFKRISKSWKKIAENCEVFIQLADFISQNHTITSQSASKTEFFWLTLKNCQLLLLGEQHSCQNHRQLHADVIHACWKGWQSFNKILFTESPHKGQYGQVEYVELDIIKHSRSWDLDLSEILVIWEELKKLPAIFIPCQNIFLDKQQSAYELFKKMDNFVNFFKQKITTFENIPQNVHQALKNIEEGMKKISTNLALLETQTTDEEKASNIKHLKAQFYYRLQEFKKSLENFLQHMIVKTQRIEQLGNNPKREENLLECIFQSLTNETKIVLIAGAHHITNPSFKSALNIKKGLRFLSLISAKNFEKDETGYFQPWDCLSQCIEIFNRISKFEIDFSFLTFEKS